MCVCVCVCVVFFFVCLFFLPLSNLFGHTGSQCTTWKLRSAGWRVESLVAAGGIFDLCAGLFSCGMLTVRAERPTSLTRDRIQPAPSALGGQSLSHWTAREVPQSRILNSAFQQTPRSSVPFL